MKKKYRIELEVVSGPEDGRVFAEDGDVITLGSTDENDFNLFFDEKVAGKWHLKFLASKDGVWHMASGSAPTFLDGTKTSDAEIHVGQVLKVGDTELMVTLLEPGAAGGEETKGGEGEENESHHQRVKVCPGKDCRAENDASERYCGKCGRRLD